MLHISVQYQNISADSQKKYAEDAYTLAQQLGDAYILSRSLNQMGAVFFNNGKYDSSIYYYQQAIDVCDANGMEDQKVYGYTNIGNVYMRLADYIRALAYYDTGLTYAEKYDDNRSRGRILSNIGSIYYDQGAYSKALNNFLEGLEIHEEMDNQHDIALSVLNLSNVYYRLKDYPKAKQYIARAMDMAKKTTDKWSVISCHTTYASIFNEEKKYDSSLLCLQEALALSLDINQPYVTNLLKGNIAECYLHMGRLDSAYVLYKESIKVSEKLKDIEGIAIAKGGVGQVLVKKGQKELGLRYIEEGLALMEEAGMKQQALELAEILATTHEEMGNYKNALKYTKLKEAYEDSLSLDKAKKEASSLQFEYELAKKEAQITLLEKNNALEAGKTKLNRMLLAAALVGMLLASIIAFQFFRNLKRARITNELILKQKQEIESQARKLEVLNNFKDTTFSVLSHDLRSPINALTGTMSMLDEGIITPGEFALYKQELNNKLQSVTLMLDNLLQWAKMQMKGEHTLDLEKINIRRKTLKAFAVLKDAADQKNIKLVAEVPENLYAMADKNQAEMVMRNLVSNAIKFTPVNGTVTVAAEKNGSMAAIKVIDTGVGMTKEQIDKLFDGTPNQSTQGTGGEKGTGIGLQLSYNFVRNNGGNIVVESEPGRGTTFLLTLPA